MTTSSPRYICFGKEKPMLQKKKGFTLIEVLVVMLVATLVFSMVGGVMVFITTATDDYIKQAEEINMAKDIEKYLRTLVQQEDVFSNSLLTNKSDSRLAYLDNGDIKFDGNVVFSKTNLDSFYIYQDQEFIKCDMTFKSGRNFNFIIDVK